MQWLVHATREASWAMFSSSHIWKRSFVYSLTILYTYSEYLDDIYSQHVPSTVLLISSRSLLTFMSFVCNSLHPVTAAWWNVDWSCWLGLVQIYYFYFLCNHDCSEFRSAATVSCAEDSISQHLSLVFSSLIFFCLLFCIVPRTLEGSL